MALIYKVAEHQRQLATFGFRRHIGSWTNSRRSSAQCGDRVEQLATMADRGNAKFLQILGRQSRKDRTVDVVLAKESLVLVEA